MTERPFVRVTAGDFAGMTGVLMSGAAGAWLVYLTCWGRYVTVPAIEPEELRPMTAAQARRERVA